MKALLRKINKNPQETNREAKEAGIQIKDLEHMEEKIFNQSRKKKTDSKKKRIG